MAVGEMMIDEAAGTVHCGMSLFRLIVFGEGRFVTDALCHCSMRLGVCSWFCAVTVIFLKGFQGQYALG